jgi:hypothetical protein
VDRKLEEAEAGVNWDDEAVAELEGRFGKDLAADLIDLGTLYSKHGLDTLLTISPSIRCPARDAGA